MAVTVYEAPHTTKHLAGRCSCAYVVWLAMFVASVLVPYFVAFHTNGLWVKELPWSQQPTVHFKHVAMLAVEGTDSEGAPLHRAWSTEPAVNALYGDSLRVSEISSFENDVDRDGKSDTVEVSLMMPLDTGETIQHATAMLFFDYQLDEGVSVDMEGVVFVDGSSPIPGQSMWVAGDLRLRQLKPVPYRAVLEDYSESVLDTQSPRLADLQFTSLLSSYSARNLTTFVDNEQQVWTPGPGGSADAKLPFTITVHLRIPDEIVRYRPGFWEMIKYGWVQYIAIFFVVRYLLWNLEDFIYTNSVVQTVITHAQTTPRKPKF